VSIRVRDIQQALDAWAPRSIAWERDNCGLQCGDLDMAVRGILVCLDITEGVVQDALRRRANLIVSHHPLLFHPLSSVTPATYVGRALSALIRKNVSALSIHTNLDAAPEGTSFALARALGVTSPETLDPGHDLLMKLVTFVPTADVERVATALCDAGAGVIGNYEQCSFRTDGTGTFWGNDAASPTVGRRGKLERVAETRLEMVVDRHRLAAVVDALRNAHPYEEPAYDLVPLENAHRRFGMGAIGDLSHPVTFAGFLRRVRRALEIKMLRYTGDLQRKVGRIAVCGGSGSSMMEHAIAQRADVFVTADISFHRFQDAAGRIALVDAGHHETEFPVLAVLAGRLRDACRVHGGKTPVAVSGVRTNPVAYV
jgi:dinuclear metal center YbgI/SA1388 family protein